MSASFILTAENHAGDYNLSDRPQSERRPIEFDSHTRKSLVETEPKLRIRELSQDHMVNYRKTPTTNWKGIQAKNIDASSVS